MRGLSNELPNVLLAPRKAAAAPIYGLFLALQLAADASLCHRIPGFGSGGGQSRRLSFPVVYDRKTADALTRRDPAERPLTRLRRTASGWDCPRATS